MSSSSSSSPAAPGGMSLPGMRPLHCLSLSPSWPILSLMPLAQACISRRLSTSFAMQRSTTSALCSESASVLRSSRALLKSPDERCQRDSAAPWTRHGLAHRLERGLQFLADTAAMHVGRHELLHVIARQRVVHLADGLVRLVLGGLTAGHGLAGRRTLLQGLDALGKADMAKVVERRHLQALLLAGHSALQGGLGLAQFAVLKLSRARVVILSRRVRGRAPQLWQPLAWSAPARRPSPAAADGSGEGQFVETVFAAPTVASASAAPTEPQGNPRQPDPGFCRHHRHVSLCTLTGLIVARSWHNIPAWRAQGHVLCAEAAP